MSGPEFALALLPILISAVEHYDDCFRPLTRYRKFASELNRFQQLLKIQKAIFRNQCRILLENAVSQDVANQMLTERNHLSWCDVETERLLMEQLGSSREACVAVIELIDKRLCGIEKESRGFGIIVDQELQARSIGDKAWLNRAVKKLRFSFSESRLEQSITHLRALNDDFRALAEHEKHSADKPLGATLTKTRSFAMIEKYRIIGKASRQVYEALGKACTKHTEHLAHLSMDVEHESPNELAASQIKFNMAFTQIMLSGTVKPDDPIWFVIGPTQDDITTETKSQRDDCLDGLGRSLKRQLEISSTQVSQMPKGRGVVTTAPPLVASSSLPTSFSIAPVQYPSIRRDFCDYLVRWSRQSSQENSSVGILEITDCCRYFVYPPASPVQTRKKRPTSLNQLLSSVSKKELGLRIPQYEKISLAKSLAMAVLQYHATPWLKLSWRSEDIFFFDRDELPVPQGKLFLKEPHLNVKIRGPDGQLPESSTLAARSLVRNPLLFGLGIVLIEIANSSTLQGLQQSSDLDDGQENQYTEYHVAKRLANSLGREMGASYGKIVQKLLYCDFGCGDDLNDPELQARLHKDVVCELDELERGFRFLQLGSK